jgi:hypothetical protein
VEAAVGALIPTPNDQDVIVKLNLRFAAYGLTGLRQWQEATKEYLFDGNHSLHRVSYRLGLYPAAPGGQARWIYFLRYMLRPASGGKTVAAIKNVLSQALADTEVDSVVFNVLEDPNVNDYILYPNNDNQPVVSNDTVNGQIVYLVTLVCPRAAVIPSGQPNVPPPDPTPESNRPFPSPILPIPPIPVLTKKKKRR